MSGGEESMSAKGGEEKRGSGGKRETLKDVIWLMTRYVSGNASEDSTITAMP